MQYRLNPRRSEVKRFVPSLLLGLRHDAAMLARLGLRLAAFAELLPLRRDVQYHDIQGVMAANDSMALGVVKA